MSFMRPVTNKELAQKILDMHRDSNEHLNKVSDRLSDLGRGADEQSERLRLQAVRLEELEAKLQQVGVEAAAAVDNKIQGLVEHIQRHASSLLGERATTFSDAETSEKLVRATTGRVFNRDKPSANKAFDALLKFADADVVDDNAWQPILAEALVEAAAVPGAAQVFERQAFVESYLSDITRKFGARYSAGWVTLDDALFLYWLVRQTKPRNIVQCGAFNGRSSAFMMLALAKNGAEGTLNIIDAPPPVFDPANPHWTVGGKYYSAVIPAGKTNGWMVPDQYRDRVKIWNGDVQELLPQVISTLESVDLFYCASDHLYHPVKAEFEHVRSKLPSGGLAIAIDAGWNAALWEFTDKQGVPSYTFKNAVGVGFF